ncbi:ABC transporter substrate-binding protein [Tenuibacillus multivorans]|uniref:Iron complex transport system substrate-binding protein n=1 Tax=Tenuibacillus multivorans TaxID=237069 RepID=A0A1H0B849_9BACI|nr:ABC transporter substrate-binding protein [Tenuibacillus multivorans]GEL78605.1 putative ABC transporter substrate-binding lipoprotein YvrC [Tenuibacillus multivorans]SDN41840.1 iron complex transport system substrate-binding protein [Tenuibacillus multivorans]
MQKKFWSKWLIVLVMLLAVGLAACQGDSTGEETNDQDQTEESGEEQGDDNSSQEEEPSDESSSDGFEAVTLTDKSGTEVTIEELPERIVSVIPSATETVFTVGAGEQVVGVSDNANYPEDVQDIERVGGLQLNIEKIVSLEPDLVVADVNNGEDINALRQAGLNVLVLGAQNLEAVYEDIKLVGQATGHVDQADEIISGMKADVEEVQEVVSGLSEDEKKKVWIEVGPELFSGGEGSFIDEMIDLAGGINIIGDQEGWPQVSEEIVLEKDPDVIITTYGYYIDNSVEQVLARENWQNVTAVKEEQVYDLHSDMLTRPGPRLTEGLKTLAKTFYPDHFE